MCTRLCRLHFYHHYNSVKEIVLFRFTHQSPTWEGTARALRWIQTGKTKHPCEDSYLTASTRCQTVMTWGPVLPTQFHLLKLISFTLTQREAVPSPLVSLRLPGGFQGLFWVTVVALECHVVGKTLAFCPVSLWLQKRKTLVSTHRATPLSPYMEVFAFWLPEDLSQENWCWGPGCGITKAFEGLPRACPWINVCWTGFEVSFTVLLLSCLNVHISFSIS